MATPATRRDLASTLQSAYHHFDSLLNNTGAFEANSLRAKCDRYDDGRAALTKAWGQYCDCSLKDLDNTVREEDVSTIIDQARVEPRTELELREEAAVLFRAVKTLAACANIDAEIGLAR